MIKPGGLTCGRVNKLLGMRKVCGLIGGNFGEISEDTHTLVTAVAKIQKSVEGGRKDRIGCARGGTEGGGRAQWQLHLSAGTLG